MDFNLSEWINLLSRWLHIIFAISWIGQTYLFIRFERSIEKPPDTKLPDNVAGQMWMVHGGGFFVVEKLTGLTKLPFKLHWFKWEAFFTWLTGAVLLVVVYYMGGLMVGSPVDLSENACIAIGVVSLVLAWPVYELLWRSPLGKNETIGSLASYALLLAVYAGLKYYLPTRAAFFHIGAMLGTIMVANVWLLIVPAQKQIVRMIAEGRLANMSLAARARQSSKQNSFMGVTVILTMISYHFPTTTFGAPVWYLAGYFAVSWIIAKIIRDGFQWSRSHN